MMTLKLKTSLLLILALTACPALVYAQQADSTGLMPPQQELLILRKKVKERGQKIKDLTLEKQMMQGIIKELTQDKDRLEGELYDLLFGDFRSSAKKSIVSQMDEVRRPYEEDVRTLNKIIASYKSELDEKEKDAEQFMALIDATEKKLTTAEEEQVRLQSALKELRIELSDTEKLSREKEKKLEAAFSKQAEDRRIALQAQIDVLTAQLKQKEHEYNTYENKYEEENKQLTEKISLYKAQLQDEGRAVVRKESEVEKLNEKIVAHKKEISQLKKETGKSKIALDNRDAQLLEINGQLIQYKGQVKGDEKAINTLKKTKTSLEKEYNALLEKYDSTRGQLSKKIKTQEKKVMKVEQQNRNKLAYWNLLKEEVQNALDLLSY